MTIRATGGGEGGARATPRRRPRGRPRKVVRFASPNPNSANHPASAPPTWRTKPNRAWWRDPGYGTNDSYLKNGGDGGEDSQGDGDGNGDGGHDDS